MSYRDDRMQHLIRVFTVCRNSSAIFLSEYLNLGWMYLKWMSQNLTSFANSLSLSLSLSHALSFYPHANMTYLLLSYNVEVVCTDFTGRNDIAPAGIERETWLRIRSAQIAAIYHETHVFAMVIRPSHCFKIGSYKFLAEGCSVYWLTAYCISMPPLIGTIHIKCCCPFHFAWTWLVKQLQLTPF